MSRGSMVMSEPGKTAANRGEAASKRSETATSKPGETAVSALDSANPSSDNRVTCPVCPRACALAQGEHGACRARRAVGGRVVAENYGRVTSLALDPIEKKPLARFRPGTQVLSVGSYGCNLHCPFCQNASIACAGESDVSWRELAPADLVDMAASLVSQGNIGIAYTYNEPLVGYEFVRDTARLAHERGLANVVVSNGCVNEGPLGEIAALIDAANIDLKGFTPAFNKLVGADEACVRHTIEVLAQTPTCHLEVTTLVIPGLNDTDEEIDAAARWLASLDETIVYHLTRFFPRHHLRDRAPTPRSALYRLAEVARRHLPYVVVGNC